MAGAAPPRRLDCSAANSETYGGDCECPGGEWCGSEAERTTGAAATGAAATGAAATGAAATGGEAGRALGAMLQPGRALGVAPQPSYLWRGCKGL